MLSNWIANLTTPQATLFGACIAAAAAIVSNLLVGLLKDFVAQAWAEEREKKRSAEQVFQRYAEPLASATASLFWRLRESLAGDGRGLYLVAVEPRTEFERYKVVSTHYRLGAVLGCLRALNREFSYVRVSQTWRLRSLENAIADFETSLADGHEVEIKRLRGLLQIWGIQRMSDREQEKRLGTQVAQSVKSALVRSPAQGAPSLPDDEKLSLCQTVARIVGIATNQSLSDDIIRETMARAIRQIAAREAWIFRDWQTAIGDMMIKQAALEIDRFEIIGFGDFEQIVSRPTDDQARNLRRISALFHGLDLEREDPFDARKEVLLKIFRSTSLLILALHHHPASAAFVSDATRLAASAAAK